jgi:prolipoprotein diacylglyceryltransferase
VRFGPDSLAVLTGGAPIVGRGDSLTTLPLHPTQLYEAIGLLVLLAMTWGIRIRVGVERPWRMASRYALGYGLLRASVEVFRGDLSRGFLIEWSSPTLAGLLSLPPDHPLALSISQVTALVMVALGAWGLWKTRQVSEIAA